jgi:outer membrane protein assembly factor BamB
MNEWYRSLAVVCGLWTTAIAHGGDWPQFRGPTGQGHAEGKLPIHWAPDKNITWKQSIPGQGWSSPIVVAGRVYLTTAVPQGERADADQSLRAVCVDARDGKIVWDHEVFRQDGKTAPRIHAKNSHASATPLIVDDRLYVHFGHQGTACLDLNGKIIWQQTELRYRPVHGNGGAPIVVDGLLIFSADGADQQFLAALDRATGKVKWKTPRSVKTAPKKFSFGTPLVITVAGKNQIINTASDAVYAHDPVDGKEIWHVRYKGYSVVPKPVVGHGLVFICTGYDSPTLRAIRTDGKGDVTETHVAWTVTRNVPLTPSLLLVGDELYLMSDTGTASCLDAKTGKEIWRERIGGGQSASPLDADGKIYFLGEDGKSVIVKAGRAFEPLARNDMKERTLASFAAVDRALYLRTESHLYRIEEK